jgi:deoxyinosine 3'endonuclease (endonuclease V)
MDLPTVGISKGILCGTAEIPKNHRGEAHPLEYKGEQIGYLLKSAKGCNPIVTGSQPPGLYGVIPGPGQEIFSWTKI